MGASQSKLAVDLSVEDISSYVTSLGSTYHEYGEPITGYSLDGAVLVEMNKVEFKDTLKCLGVTHFLHQKKLLSEWHKMVRGGSGVASKVQENRSSTSVTAAETITCTDSSSLTIDSGLASTTSSKSDSDPWKSFPPYTISIEQDRIISELDYSKDLPPDAPELGPFRQLADQARSDCNGFFAQVNLLDTGKDVLPGKKANVNNLTTLLPRDTQHHRLHFDAPEDGEICRSFILGKQDEFQDIDIPKEFSDFFGVGKSKYYGHIIRYGDLRVGTICVLVEDACAAHEQIFEVLRFLATLVRAQLEKRQALLQRSQNLRSDLQQLPQLGDDPVLAPSFGPVGQVTVSQIDSRLSFFPYPGESDQHHNGCPTLPEFNRRTATLPAFQEQANEQERSHLKPTYYDNPFFQPTNQPACLDKTPISKRDMDRTALLHSLQLLQMDPLCEEARAIQSLVDLAATLLQVDVAGIDLLDHGHVNTFFTVYPNHTKKNMDSMRAIFKNYKVVRQHPHTGEPFHQIVDREIAICNYAIMTPNNQAFVVHDVAKDQSNALYSKIGGCGFYCAAPIIIRGHAMRILCCMNQERNLAFSRAQEVQLESFAHLIAQQYETWALNREVNRLERSRNLFLSNAASIRSASWPEDSAALVFTSVEGAMALWEANSSAMIEAVGLHNQILRSQITLHKGYEVSTEKASFQIAFSYAVDALNFCLQTQEALHKGACDESILELTNTSEEASFRGLRVKMAIHCGDVETTNDTVSERVKYTGEIFHIAKNLEAMAHGGQILITSDVWNLASHLGESTLGSPQVLDLGSHAMPTHSSHMHDGLAIKHLIPGLFPFLLPSSSPGNLPSST